MTDHSHKRPNSSPEIEALEKWTEDLPPSIRGKLRARRVEVLEKTVGNQRSSTRLFSPTWLNRFRLPGIGIACLAAAIVLIQTTAKTESTHNLPMPDDISLLSDNEELDLLEDMEFILWLVEQENSEKG